MYTDKFPNFMELQKASRKCDLSDNSYRLAILGNSSTQHLAIAIKGYAQIIGLDINVFDADYDQIDIQLLDNNSETFSFNPDSILINLTPERIYEDYQSLSEMERTSFADSYIEKIVNYWELIRNNSKSLIIQSTITEYDDGVFGSYGGKVRSSFLYQIRKLNYLIGDRAADNKDVFIVDYCNIQNNVGRDKLVDPKMLYMAKMSVALDILPKYAKRVVDVIAALKGQVKKCVICDLDNTLWGGIIGEDGLSGIKIGNLGSGHAYEDLQIWLKQLKQRGILLAVCSKNDDHIAKEPFEKLEEMVLKLDDFAIFVANWDNKVDNIRYIQSTLNIGFDSMVFLDDNPFERNLVRENISEVCVPELPDDPAKYLSYLQSLNLFETASYSVEDANRTTQYQVEAKRNELKLKATSYEDYLKELDMECEWNYFDSQNAPRIAQLTQRSNQFNLRTVRYTEAEILDIINDPKKVGLYFKLKDKYGDYGLISVIILNIDNNLGFIDTWLMSCRVLKRGVEQFVLNKMIQVSKKNGVNVLQGEYLETKKNHMVSNLYDDLQFDKIEENRWELDLNTYAEKNVNIREVGTNE